MKLSSHAILSPSKAEQWLRCPGSIRMSEGIIERPSEYAQEGSDAHAEAEACFRMNRPSKDEAIQKYIDFVKKEANGHKLLIEQRVTLAPWTGGYGTADAVVLAETSFSVLDLKFGKGVKVDAKDNSQLKLYALGVWEEHSLSYDFRTFKIVVCQPRIEHLSVEELPVEALLSWGETVKTAAQLALSKDAPVIAGEVQCRWCLARFVCKARAEMQLRLAQKEFSFLETSFFEGERLTLAEALVLYPHLDYLIDWAQDIKEHVLSEALAGKPTPGYKLVEGRSRRYWKPTAEEELKKLIPDADLYDRSLKGLGDIEKLLGKKHEIFPRITTKPPGKPALVREDDERPAMGGQNSAVEDFKNVET